VTEIGIFYTTKAGNTKAVAERIKAALGGDGVTLYDVEATEPDALDPYTCLILGTPTYSYGRIPKGWRLFLPHLAKLDFSRRKVALFGLGDQERFPDTFTNAMGTIYRRLDEMEATIVGRWSTEGYTVRQSTAIVDGAFVGLALDEHTQPDLTDARIAAWAAALKPVFA